MVQAKKKIALLHRYPADLITETNAAFPYLAYDYNFKPDINPGAINYYPKKRMDVLTFKKFDRLSKWNKFFKSIAWIFYAPMLVAGKGYDIIYLDDSYPFVPIFVKLACPKSKLVIRLGDLHLMYYTSGRIYKFLHFFENMGWQMADKIICISEAMAEYVSNDIRRKVEVVLDPVDCKNFLIAKSKNQGTVMFHGVLTKNKNIEMLLKAAEKLPEVKFIVIGEGPDKKRLEELAPRNVFFKGWVSFEKIPRLINTCSVGVALRSNNHGNEYVVTSPFLQYGASGKPCLVTRRKVFGDYKWQFSNVWELVIKIRNILKHPEEGEYLRDYVIKNHDATKIAEEIWSLLLS